MSKDEVIIFAFEQDKVKVIDEIRELIQGSTDDQVVHFAIFHLREHLRDPEFLKIARETIGEF